MKGTHRYQQINPLLHSRIRFAAITLLAAAGKASFRFLRQQTGASDGNLGAHMKKLRDAGYVKENKRFREEKPVTEYAITDEGRSALDDYLSCLVAMSRGDPT